ncbi:26S proteasome non-ATPase regulatory subunit 12 [Euphorbia peplus]|nr:26S proteasome non-ATPase regulatory subunit 12 [Euphorbia peplus]
MGNQTNLETAIDQLQNVEKQMRLAGDVAGTKKAVTEILQLCLEAKDWKMLNDQILLLSKKRGQLKQAVTAMVQQAMQYIDDTPDLETCIELIKTLKLIDFSP